MFTSGLRKLKPGLENCEDFMKMTFGVILLFA